MINKYKIVFISGSSDFSSGDSIAFLNFINSINTEIIEPYIVVGNYGPLYEKLAKLGFNVHVYNQNLFYWRTNKNFKKISLSTLKLTVKKIIWFYLLVKHSLWIKKFILQNEIEAIYFDTFTIGFGALEATKLGRKVIWNARECLSYHFGDSFMWESIQKKIINKSNAVCFISKSVKHEYKNWITVKKINVVYDEVNPKFYANREIFTETNVYIGVYGRISQDKGVIYIVDSVIKLLKENKNIKLNIVGSKQDETVLKSIQDKIEDANACNAIKIWPMVDSIYNDLIKTDIVCNNSIYEGFGLSAFEAMLSGALLVTNSNGSMGELLRDNKTALFFDQESKTKSLESVLKDAINKIEESKQIAKNGQKFAKKFSQGNGYKKMESIILQTIKSN